MAILKPKEMAERLNVTVKTLQIDPAAATQASKIPSHCIL